MALPLEVFDKHSELEFRNDLIDCQIDICSIEVLALFTENFDYQDLRKDFVRGILESDLLGKTIFTHILTQEYSCRVTSPHLYDVVSIDMMGRWTFPLVPDLNWTNKTDYELINHHSIYLETPIQLAHCARLIENVMIGKDSCVGKESKLVNCVVGKRVQIGSQVTLENAYIMDDVVIENGVIITKSIIGQGCVVGKESILKGNLVREKVWIFIQFNFLDHYSALNYS